jgi:hypothetical protein
MNLTPEEQEERRATALMIFAVASSLVVLALVGLFVFLITREMSAASPVSSNTNPYNISVRQLPTGQQPGELMPQTLGKWQRKTLGGRIENFGATYASGAETITIQGSRAVSLVAAVFSVRLVERSNGPANIASRIIDSDLNYSYYFSAAPNGTVRFAWSHDLWFFDVRASSREALDDFMKIFKY